MKSEVLLSSLKERDACVLTGINNIEKTKHKRLIELGFVYGEKLEVLKKNKNFLIIGIRGYCLCLDFSLANSISVVRG